MLICFTSQKGLFCSNKNSLFFCHGCPRTTRNYFPIILESPGDVSYELINITLIFLSIPSPLPLVATPWDATWGQGLLTNTASSQQTDNLCQGSPGTSKHELLNCQSGGAMFLEEMSLEEWLLSHQKTMLVLHILQTHEKLFHQLLLHRAKQDYVEIVALGTNVWCILCPIVIFFWCLAKSLFLSL